MMEYFRKLLILQILLFVQKVTLIKYYNFSMYPKNFHTCHLVKLKSFAHSLSHLI
jgi:hypothetical protein